MHTAKVQRPPSKAACRYCLMQGLPTLWFAPNPAHTRNCLLSGSLTAFMHGSHPTAGLGATSATAGLGRGRATSSQSTSDRSHVRQHSRQVERGCTCHEQGHQEACYGESELHRVGDVCGQEHWPVYGPTTYLQTEGRLCNRRQAAIRTDRVHRQPRWCDSIISGLEATGTARLLRMAADSSRGRLGRSSGNLDQATES